MAIVGTLSASVGPSTESCQVEGHIEAWLEAQEWHPEVRLLKLLKASRQEAQEHVQGGREGVCKPSWRPLGAPHMLVLIRDWLLAGVSSPWLPSLGGDCSGQERAQPGDAQVLPAP